MTFTKNGITFRIYVDSAGTVWIAYRLNALWFDCAHAFDDDVTAQGPMAEFLLDEG